MVKEWMDFVAAHDPAVGEAIRAEYERQRRNIELIASENFVSEAVLAAAGSVLTNKYAEGYPGKRYYGGCQCVDVVENIARDRACQLFGAEHANVQPHSGAQANYAVYQALCQTGDTVLGMDLANGGHLTHGSPVNFSGKNYNIVSYGLNEKGYIDYDQVRDLAKKHQPRMILAGASAYPRIIDFKTFADIAHEVGAYLFELYQHEMDYLNGLSQLTAPLPSQTEQTARDIQSSMEKIVEEETGELPQVEDEEPQGEAERDSQEEEDGGLYAELLGMDRKDREEQPEPRREHRSDRNDRGDRRARRRSAGSSGPSSGSRSPPWRSPWSSSSYDPGNEA